MVFSTESSTSVDGLCIHRCNQLRAKVWCLCLLILARQLWEAHVLALEIDNIIRDLLDIMSHDRTNPLFIQSYQELDVIYDRYRLLAECAWPPDDLTVDVSDHSVDPDDSSLPDLAQLH